MKKKCVRWTKSVRTALVAAAALMSAMVVTPHAQSNDPSAQPRLSFSDLYYVGAFRVPATASNGDSFEFGGHALAFNPANNSLFVSSRRSDVAEVSIPAAVNSSDPAALPFATYLQGFSDPMQGQMAQIAADGVSLSSLIVFGNRLVGTASVYYDANNTQQVSHFSHSLQLGDGSFSGWSRVWDATKTGFVSGSMAVVPTEWRGVLGGPAATGQCCIPIVMRTSVGPAAFSFDPTQIGQPAVAANPLLYYTLDHATLGPWDNASPVYGSTTEMGGLAMVAGTRTALYIGRNGMGTVCYGNGTADQSLVGTLGSDGAHYCYDPTDSSKGQHAYPYRYQIWAYDMNDLAAVKAGTKQPWDVVPYGVWPFDFPTHDEATKIGGVAYDAVHQLLYVSQMLVDKDGYAFRPLIHVLHVNATPGTVDPNDVTPLSTTTTTTTTTTATTTAPSPTPTAPSTSAVVSAITLSVNRTSPQLAGTAISFSAYAIGGIAPQQYKWLVNDGSGFKPVTAWSTNETFTWTPTIANAKYRVRVWARSSGSTDDEPEAIATATFAITARPPLRAVEISSDKPAPQVQGSTVTFTATPDGGSSLEYKWLIHDGVSWSTVTGWSSNRTFAWTAGAPNASNRVGVWVRTAGNTVDAGEVTRSIDFPIAGPLRAVEIASDKAAPQVTGTSVTFNARTDGGANLEYKWLVHDGLSWSIVTGWSSSNTFVWSAATANPSYRIGVWVRTAGNTQEGGEVTRSIDFPIAASTTSSTATAPIVLAATPLRSVNISSDKAAPQVQGTSITFAATADGGSALEYKWLIHDGLSWAIVTGWSSSNTFTWTPAIANPSYRIGVWVRTAGNTAEGGEVTRSIDFPISASR